MIGKKLFQFLYLAFIFLLIPHKVNAETRVTELLNDILGINVEASFLVLLIGLFFILFFILQKGAQGIFGSTTTANLVAFIISLIAIIFMPEELFTFLANWAVIIVAIAFVIAPITLIGLFNIKNKKARHLVLIIMYIFMIWSLSKLYAFGDFDIIFDMELPFLFGETTLLNIAYWVLGIAIAVSSIIILSEWGKSAKKSYRDRLEELKIKSETKKNIIEGKKFSKELK